MTLFETECMHRDTRCHKGECDHSVNAGGRDRETKDPETLTISRFVLCLYRNGFGTPNV